MPIDLDNTVIDLDNLGKLKEIFKIRIKFMIIDF
jgi:hypothetical protein